MSSPTGDHACARCLTRQPAGATCTLCGAETFDLRSRREREHVEAAEDRARDARNRRIHMIAVLTSLLIGLPLAAVVFFVGTSMFVHDDGPGSARSSGGAIKLFGALAIAFAIGPALLVEMLLERKRTSILDGVPPAERP